MIEKLGVWALPVLLTALLTSIITRKYKDKERFNLACAAFRTAFSPELAALKNPSSENTTDPYDLLLAAFDKHRTAVGLFRNFLKGNKKRRFDHAWENYYAYDDTGKDSTEFLIKYSPGWEQKPIWDRRQLAIANIEALLDFAK